MRLFLERAPDDPTQFSNDYQAAFDRLLERLEGDGAQVVPRFSIQATSGFSGSLTGEFVVLMRTFGPTAITALATWLVARTGRKVRVKIGEIEAEAKTAGELEKLLLLVQRVQRENEPKRIHEP